jgi:hypothetical protein
MNIFSFEVGHFLMGELKSDNAHKIHVENIPRRGRKIERESEREKQR